MKSLPFLLLALTLIFVCSCREQKINRYDTSRRKQGLWHEHSQLGTLMAYGSYKDGLEKGRWVHLDPEGRTWVTYHYGKQRIKVKYYRSNGNLERKGWARMDYEPLGPHFYWHGRWTFYDDNGRRDSTVRYAFGAPLP
ncbi:MAG TPA: hypothetical protein P5550_00195 [Bacteroidales bacterium]|nr:hypothetical protein [Bacteroidales bacterium]HRZ75785.1 hypothetical protein [Bacteroidales bacterium]